VQYWSITLHGPSGILSTIHSGQTQFVLGTDQSSDVWTLAGEGVAPRHALVLVAEGRMQVEDLAGGTLVNGYPITGRVETGYPASIQVGALTLVVEETAEDPSLAATLPHAPSADGFQGMDPDATIVTAPRAQPAAASGTDSASADYRGRYALVKEIARGGMGQIYFGEDPQLKRQVAVKVSSVSYGGEDPRFAKEAEVLALLAHPNIVPIYTAGADAQGRPFYAMKLVRGRTLQAVLNALALGNAAETRDYTLAALLTIFRKVCDAMAFAHAKGILHRDLKPENIMVGEYGEVLVMDWGLAKILGEKEERARGGAEPAEDSGDYGMTIEGEVMGTPQYMSPEQAGGMVAELDARSDIYSLGGILYAILTLRPPIAGKTLNEVLNKVKRGELSDMTTRRRHGARAKAGLPAAMGGEVPEALRAVTLKAMATDRSNRYAAVEAFVADIEAYRVCHAGRAGGPDQAVAPAGPSSQDACGCGVFAGCRDHRVPLDRHKKREAGARKRRRRAEGARRVQDRPRRRGIPDQELLRHPRHPAGSSREHARCGLELPLEVFRRFTGHGAPRLHGERRRCTAWTRRRVCGGQRRLRCDPQGGDRQGSRRLPSRVRKKPRSLRQAGAHCGVSGRQDPGGWPRREGVAVV
jgi:predicted Ser/Thr protein kinase